MKKFLVTVAFFGLFPVVAPGQSTAPEQGPPPTNLVERDGHWTANETPSDTENYQIHVVETGDTLWGIAAMYMDNGLLWPQLWEINEHIVNPHWIYPDDQVLIQMIQQISEVEPPPAPEPEPEPTRVPVQLPNLTPELPPLAEAPIIFNPPPQRAVPTVKASDLYCSGFVSAAEVDGPTVVARAAGTSPAGYLAVRGDYVYIDRGRSGGIQPGDMFTAIRPTRKIDSPRDRVGDLGRHYLEIAHLEAVTVQGDFSMARVVHSCDGLGVGDSLIPFTEITIPEPPANRPFSATMASTGGTSGAVAAALSVHQIMDRGLGASTQLAGRSSSTGPGRLTAGASGEGQIVYIDLGSRDGVEAGDLMLVYRPVDLDQFVDLSGDVSRMLSSERIVVGELIVLKVEERAATALITYSEDAVSRGDRVELR